MGEANPYAAGQVKRKLKVIYPLAVTFSSQMVFYLMKR